MKQKQQNFSATFLFYDYVVYCMLSSNIYFKHTLQSSTWCETLGLLKGPYNSLPFQEVGYGIHLPRVDFWVLETTIVHNT